MSDHEEAAERPHLQAVREEAEDAELVEKTPEEPKRGRGTIISLLCLALIVCVFVMLTQARQTDALQSQVVAMEGEIAEAQAALGAAEAQVERYEARLDEVRGGLEGLATQVEALRRLAGAPPATAADGEYVEAE